MLLINEKLSNDAHAAYVAANALHVVNGDRDYFVERVGDWFAAIVCESVMAPYEQRVKEQALGLQESVAYHSVIVVANQPTLEDAIACVEEQYRIDNSDA